ncbi:hypothetical protein IAI53_01610 [Thauera sp. CAU 1555]|uniref:Uncharacterized protein n=1 Tax=Thauera sedimentorum TaxID=2767595 RepID=A0ABR9B5B4_9RHOO|nr:hypothetical protein [Thauera sedimentorum]MBC9070654.1 hypothetical protein [Thauera sedimentorum]MBD8501573.1 hypothetical protein [Thauera sedimentorum]
MTRPLPASTPVATSKTAALARVLDLVPKGYSYYVSGKCPAGRVRRLAQKFHERYGIGCSPAQRLLRKQRGLANAQLVLYWPNFEPHVEAPDERIRGQENPDITSLQEGAQQASRCLPEEAATTSDQTDSQMATPRGAAEPLVDWLLLVTPGEGQVRANEALKDITKEPRLIWLGYELVRHAVRGKPSWTWRRPREAMREWYALLSARQATNNAPAVEESLAILARQPGFAGIRAQTFELFHFVRQHGYRDEFPFVFFVQKQPAGARLRL